MTKYFIRVPTTNKLFVGVAPTTNKLFVGVAPTNNFFQIDIYCGWCYYSTLYSAPIFCVFPAKITALQMEVGYYSIKGTVKEIHIYLYTKRWTRDGFLWLVNIDREKFARVLKTRRRALYFVDFLYLQPLKPKDTAKSFFVKNSCFSLSGFAFKAQFQHICL